MSRVPAEASLRGQYQTWLAVLLMPVVLALSGSGLALAAGRAHHASTLAKEFACLQNEDIRIKEDVAFY